MADKPAETDEAEAYEVNDAKADEADAEANEADDAEAKLAEANEIVEAAEADASDEAIESDKSGEADEVDEAGVFIETPLLLSFSLTKFFAIFSEVKGSFGVNNNQLLGFEAAV